MKTKVLVLGAGAVGLSVAARLSTVCDVSAVTHKQQVDAIRADGFLMTGIWGEATYSLRVEETVPMGERFDYILITSKSTSTREICEQNREVLRGTPVISLQNGIGNEEIIAEYTDQVIGGMIITGFERQGDRSVHISVEGGPMKLGRFPWGEGPEVSRFVDLVASAGIPVMASSEIRTDLWSKTIYNCALNPLGALMGVPYGALTDPAAWRIITSIVTEAYAVVRAEGVALPWGSATDLLTYLHDVQIPSTAGHHASMLMDLVRGRRTEIDFMNGAVVAAGARHRIETPVNACIADLIRFRETLPNR